MKLLINNLKKTVVFLGKINDDGNAVPYATAFLISINNYFHLITAKHVVINPKDQSLRDGNLMAFFNGRDGKLRFRSISDLKIKNNLTWVFHHKPEVDVAIIPFPLDPVNDDVKVIPNDRFLLIDNLQEVYDIFFFSYQPGVETEKIMPIIRNGTISLINSDRTFYIDAAAFPGNSGSPVFLKPSLYRYDDNGNITIGGDTIGGKFIGLIGSYIPYQEAAISTQTGNIRVVFEENTGLSRVWSVSFINDIVESEDFKKQMACLTST